MGRHTGPVERLNRREGVDLELKGERRLTGKGALERRGPTPPGQHGQARRTKPSVYSVQLREKQKLKRYYGIREKQMRRYLQRAQRPSRVGTVGEELVALLEQRLDNVVFRLGLATTRAQARQFVAHGHVIVDGRRCDIASRHVDPGSTLSLRTSSPVASIVGAATELVGRVPAWLEADHEALGGRVLRRPVRAEAQVPIEEQMVVELLTRT